MSESERDVHFPIDVGLIRDPDSGRPTAMYEIFDIGDVPEEDRVHVQKTIEALQRARDEMNSPIERKMAASIARINMLRFAHFVQDVPKSSQFIAVGPEKAFAVGVSYNQPHDTPPSEHPVIDQAVRAANQGEEYLTLKVHRSNPRKK